ncbi:MAG: holo-ACP synthase [Candidatus Nanopelagicales bacterium]|jgi:holo-[acyl-carrier protein] synthase|nr:holo-ACP synthase [Candidatus Nanopelagicales bacterium]MDP4666402.1 holo-ACP synthase [Candidatus Nanopelagicales bacterium]MDP4896023.1 holo-ACP synthase [Candidatus Nanopelagicales bacterium]MDP5050105.1 holo-ACP synthase [Candidatus Nanopelagicales bacterium]
MAIVGIGVDVVDLARFANLVERTPQIVDRLFTKAEQVSAEGHQLSVMSLAGRFAVKEAVAKALGAPAGMAWHDCEVSNGGAPTISIRGTVADAAANLLITNWHVSISHDGPVAIAYVIAERV